MKKSFVVAFLMMGLVFVSCNKDDDGGEVTTETRLVGTWKLISGLSAGEPDELNDCDKQTIAVFKDDSTFSEEYHYTSGDSCLMSPTSGTWEITSEGKLKANYNTTDGSDFETELSDFEISGNTLKVIYGTEGGEDSNTYLKQ
mgnify:FL=1